MSEEIIINDVNVAECRFLDEWKHCDICNELCDSKCIIVEDIECKTYDDCYYKQLKRLQAENEKLREEIYATRNNRLKMYESFETECNKYRQALEEIKKLINETCWDYTDISIIPVKDKMLEIINEVLKDER